MLFILGLALSPFGKQKLGSKEDTPEFSRWAWIAMLYSAGMGAGILLRAVQEPVFMQQHPPIQTGASPDIIALEYTFYQWGFTAWAFYGLFALIIGYYLFTQKRSALVSASIQSITKHKLPRHGIDILATFTTVFGLVGAVGLGTTQINGGLNHITQGDFGLWTTIGITLCIAILAFVSVWKGMHKGIKRISTLNIWMTLAILIYVFVQSDMVAVVYAFAKAVTHYIKDFVQLSLAVGAYDPEEAFLTDWTYYYWAFWLAWAPFTGIFIARISRGRTIRELLLGVLIIPAMGTFFWFSVFGDSAFTIIENWGAYNNEFGYVFSSIFVFFENYPFASILNVITIILLVSFLVTSVDSAVFVLSMFTDKGNPNPKRRHRLIWSVGIALFAIAMIVLGNARPEINVLVALQKLLIITSLPFALFMVVMVMVFVRDIVRKKKVSYL
ncbi:glycine betaine transporter OpuD [Dokdonia pacifica]|uniref:Glycine betaine transporter n=1 Tax=Dokdonia pacifica TaxID=1627892 RepID=A0A239AVQ5_9FLAO|nr:glycine betaine transporter OpuD [Dokdonia pacifica]SNR99412.1 glycine betaine transporter [Dokdonia pacifica]